VLLQFSNIQVTRRYKQFDWLHQRLTEKFNTIAVPPLPGKQITGLGHWCLRQGVHLSRKPGNVREFDSFLGNVRKLTKRQGNDRKILSGKTVYC